MKTTNPESSLRVNTSIVWSETIKNMKFLAAYPVIFVFWTIFPLFWFIPFVLQGQALVGTQGPSELWKGLTGNAEVVPFIIVGAILNGYVLNALYGVGESIREEAYQGTLDYVLASPCNKAYVLIGKALSGSISSTIYAIIQFLVCVFLFGITMTALVIMPIILVIILLIFGLYGIALMLAAVSLQLKQAHEVAHTLDYIFYVFAPVRYPLQALPFWAQVIGQVLPLTYALVATRGLMFGSESPEQIYLSIFLLAMIDMAAILIGFYMFNWMEERTKKSGSISHY